MFDVVHDHRPRVSLARSVAFAITAQHTLMMIEVKDFFSLALPC